ncbi:hypothetical protein DIPPA_00780 [Diplonema papillatum]|nr:hypothetical protein DIPPA_00780 [Diplonema papillatum]
MVQVQYGLADVLKVLFVGDEGCGKTAVCSRLRGDDEMADDVGKNTVGVDVTKACLTGPGQGSAKRRVSAQLWDAAGKRKFLGDTILDACFYKVDVVVVVVDASEGDLQIAKSLKHWVDLVRRRTTGCRTKTIVVYNKRDQLEVQTPSPHTPPDTISHTISALQDPVGPLQALAADIVAPLPSPVAEVPRTRPRLSQSLHVHPTNRFSLRSAKGSPATGSFIDTIEGAALSLKERFKKLLD